MSFIVALFTDTSTELMSGASRKWVHHNSTNQPTNQYPNGNGVILNDMNIGNGLF